MKINYNSWHARLFRYLAFMSYNRPEDMPSSLCTYFWVNFFMYLFVLLFSPLFIVGFILSKIPFFGEITDSDKYPRLISFPIITVFVSLLVAWIWQMISFPFGNKDAMTFAIMGYFVVIVILGLVFSDEIEAFFAKFKKKEGEEKSSNLIVAMFRAAKQKICPILEWTNIQTPTEQSTPE